MDFDGVILDTETPVLRSWEVVLSELGRPVPDKEAVELCLGGPYEDLDRLFRDALGSATGVETAIARRRALTALFLASEAVRPGVEDWLSAAAALSVPIAVVSSSPSDWVQPHLDRLRITDRIASVACADECRAPKPAPSLYLAAAEMIGVWTHRCIAVEDSSNGIKSAVAAGIGTIVGVRARRGAVIDFSGATVVTDSLDLLRFEDLVDPAG